MNMKIAIAMLALATVASQAHAEAAKPFTCETKLDYARAGEIKTIQLRVTGERTKKDTLNGKGVWVEAGTLAFKLNLPAVNLSSDVVSLEGTNTKEQASLKLVMLGTSSNTANGASLSVRTANGSVVTASNLIMAAGDGSTYPINCSIEQF